MSYHVPDNLLLAFVEGDVGEQLAIHIASHLDECPACATRATAFDPLAASFAACVDPMTPADLLPAVLEALDQPSPTKRWEISIGIALHLIAAMLVAAEGEPVTVMLQMGTIIETLPSLTRSLQQVMSAYIVAIMGFALLTGLAASLAARLIWNQREAA